MYPSTLRVCSGRRLFGLDVECTHEAALLYRMAKTIFIGVLTVLSWGIDRSIVPQKAHPMLGQVFVNISVSHDRRQHYNVDGASDTTPSVP